MNTLILSNGDLYISPHLLQLAHKTDYVIAADGGSRHCSAIKRSPDTLIGDLDSVPEHLLQEFKNGGTKILQYPARKNATDLELSIDHAIQEGAGTIYFAGMLGGRWDMSLANIFLLAHDKYKQARLVLFGDGCVMHILHPGKHALTTKPKQRASLLPLKGDGENIILSGVEYPLTQHTISFGSSIGVSNVTVSTMVHIEHTKGVLLFIVSS